MDGLNHLRKQGCDAFVDETLEEIYSLLIIQIQPEILLKQINALPEQNKSRDNACHFDSFLEECARSTTCSNQLTLTSPFWSGERTGIFDLPINLNRFKMRLLDFRKMLYASQQ
jgi:hypothetical protein